MKKSSFLHSFSPRVQKAYTLIRDFAQSMDDLANFNRLTLDIWVDPFQAVTNFKGKITPDQLLLLQLEQYYLHAQIPEKYYQDRIKEIHIFLYESLRKRHLL